MPCAREWHYIRAFSSNSASSGAYMRYVGRRRYVIAYIPNFSLGLTGPRLVGAAANGARGTPGRARSATRSRRNDVNPLVGFPRRSNTRDKGLLL